MCVRHHTREKNMHQDRRLRRQQEKETPERAVCVRHKECDSVSEFKQGEQIRVVPFLNVFIISLLRVS